MPTASRIPLVVVAVCHYHQALPSYDLFLVPFPAALLVDLLAALSHRITGGEMRWRGFEINGHFHCPDSLGSVVVLYSQAGECEMLGGWQVILCARCGREVRRVWHDHPA